MAVALALCATACQPDLYTGGCDIVYGDPSLPIEIEPGQFKNEQFFQPLADGDVLDLRRPPQGGQVAYVGARVTNILGCDVAISAAVYPVGSDEAFARNERNNALVPVPGQPGMGEFEPDDPANFSNIPLCPNYATEDFLGVESVLVVTITERLPCPEGLLPGMTRDGLTCDAEDNRVLRRGEVRLTVVPTCTESGSPAADANRALCECECLAGYCLGACSDPPLPCEDDA